MSFLARPTVPMPEFDRDIENTMKTYFEENGTVRSSNFKISDDEMANSIGSSVVRHSLC